MDQARKPPRKRAFRLKLYKPARQPDGADPLWFEDLRTVIYTGPNRADRFDLIEREIGLEIDYGRLTAYLFRRFGYPNSGWDNYKDLIRYELSTPAPDMYMVIRPHVRNSACISIMFMIEREKKLAIDLYERGPGLAHRARMHEWIEQTMGLPAWADECLQVVRRNWAPSLDTFLAAIPYLQLYKRGPGTGAGGGAAGVNGVPAEWLQWADEACAAFEAIDPRPGLFLRSENIESWPDEDPLKRYALAAIKALKDLATPVRVRSNAINAFGAVEDPRFVLDEPAVAGYPSGALGNAAPKEFAELHTLIMQLGKGDARRGVNKVLRSLSKPPKAL